MFISDFAIKRPLVTTVAMLFVGACYTRAAQRQMPARVAELPALADLIRTFEELLRTA